MTSIRTEAIEAAAEAMYEDFRQAHQGRFGMTPSWAKLGGPQKDEWRRHSRVASRVFLEAGWNAGYLLGRDTEQCTSVDNKRRCLLRPGHDLDGHIYPTEG